MIPQSVHSDCDLSVREIIARIQRHQDQFLSKFTKKKQSEDLYYEKRYAGYSPSRQGAMAKDTDKGTGKAEERGAAVVVAASPSNGALSR